MKRILQGTVFPFLQFHFTCYANFHHLRLITVFIDLEAVKGRMSAFRIYFSLFSRAQLMGIDIINTSRMKLNRHLAKGKTETKNTELELHLVLSFQDRA